MRIEANNVAIQAVAAKAAEKTQKQEENESWFGNQLRKVGMDDTANWLEDKDKICTDGKDDGSLTFADGFKSYAKGFFGGIPKAIINNPLTSLAVVAGAVGLTIATGGAALVPLTVAGGALSAAGLGYGAYKAVTAENDGEAKQALETAGASTMGLVLTGAAVKPALRAGQAAGVRSIQNVDDLTYAQAVKTAIKSTPDALKTSGQNIKGNALTWMSQIKGDKVIYAHSNATRQDVMVGHQSGGGNKVESYKVDLTGTPEEILAKNPGLCYDEAANKFYVQTSWGSKSYVDENYMFVKYGPGDNNAVSRADFFDSYVDEAKFAANGTKEYIDPAKLEAGQAITVTKEAPAKFKIVPEGTKYVGKETLPGTVDQVQPKSVLRIDGFDSPYQSTVEFMFKKVQLTPEQIAQLKAIDPEAAAKYGY